MRFRKSIQIVKGVRINFSKSGISTTLGGRGASINIGPKGTYLNTSIPGTGLYNRQKISGPKNAHRTPSRAAPPARLPSGDVRVIVSDDGSVEIRENGVLITDEAMLRRIKRTEEYKVLKARLMQQLKEGIEKETASMIELYKLAVPVQPASGYERELSLLKPQEYVKEPFREPAPDGAVIRDQLFQEAGEKIKTIAFWKLKHLREQYVEQELPERYEALCRDWRARKEKHDALQLAMEKQNNIRYHQEYEAKRYRLTQAIEGNEEYIDKAAVEWISSVELPVEFNIQFDYAENEGRMMLDLDLPEIEAIPTDKAVQLASGQVKRKAKTQKERKLDYMHCVFGIAVFFASHLFNISPVIREIVVSGYTQRRDKKTGDMADDYIYSIRFLRSGFERINFESIDILKFWAQFENRCLPTSTYELKTIVPFDE